MASTTNSKINELAQVSQDFVPQAAEQPLMSFLSLSPTTSAPYTPRVERRPLPERRLSGFLTLAPSVSDSYPRSRHQSISHLTRPLPLTHGSEERTPIVASPTLSASAVIPEQAKSRRSSSTSSISSSSSRGNKFRVLKLGPVHWGEHLGEHKEDWHEVDESEEGPLSP